MNYEQLTNPYIDSMFDSLKKFVAIDSVYDEKTVSKENPFGVGVSNALKFIENLAKLDGFIVTNYNNMIVEILCGTGKKNITILAHADVVPVGTGWDHDPFDVNEVNGILYGRGVADDKGPLLSSYYAMKALRDNNLIGDYTVRFLVGGNEESGSRGVDYYFNELKKPQTDLGFSPDSSFPIIYAEKGIVGYVISFPLESKDIKSFNGGVASNSVIEKFDVVLANGETLSFQGTAAHGSIPWEGDNAAIKGLKYLGKQYNLKDLNRLVDLVGETRGEGLNANFVSEEMGTSSCNLGLINYDGKTVKAVVNFRHTEKVTTDEVSERVFKACAPFKVEEAGRSPLLYFPVDSVLVKTLLNAYREETGDMDTPPQTTGGGTYAKETTNCVAFGAEFPGWDAHMHSPGERIKKSDLIKTMSIYAHAIADLGKAL